MLSVISAHAETRIQSMLGRLYNNKMAATTNDFYDECDFDNLDFGDFDDLVTSDDNNKSSICSICGKDIFTVEIACNGSTCSGVFHLSCVGFAADVDDEAIPDEWLCERCHKTPLGSYLCMPYKIQGIKYEQKLKRENRAFIAVSAMSGGYPKIST